MKCTQTNYKRGRIPCPNEATVLVSCHDPRGDGPEYPHLDRAPLCQGHALVELKYHGQRDNQVQQFSAIVARKD